MVIYKQLCHYETVKETVAKFNQTFAPAFEAIQSRKPLEKNPIIARRALLDYDLQTEANFVDLIQRELEDLRSYNWRNLKFYEETLQAYESKIPELKLRLESHIRRKAPKIAEELLDAKEQVDFLDYSAQLDALRIVRRGENRNYRSESINYLRFDTIFWIFKGEYWLDEPSDYRVLISSQCERDPSTMPTGTEGGFEEADF